MAVGSRKIIGLAMGERVIHAAELRVSGARRSLGHAAAFTLGDTLKLDDAAAVGSALKKFLAENKLRGKQVVIGLPAAWLMAKRQQVPANVKGDALAGVLRLQAERQFAAEARDIVVDYVAGSGEPKDSVLLVATVRKRMQQATAIAEAAGLKVLAVTSTGAALAMADADSASRIVVQVEPTAVEVAVRGVDQFAALQHIHLPDQAGATAASSTDVVANELRRMIAVGGVSEVAGDKPALTIWDGIGLSADAMQTIGRRTMVGDVRRGELTSIAEFNGVARPEKPERFAAAVALARVGADRALMPVDFLHSRLAPVKKRRIDKRLRIPALIALLILVGIGWLVMDWSEKAAAVASLQKSVDSDKDHVKKANELVSKVSYAEGWFAQRSKVLELMRELTNAFPEDRIWAASVSLRDDLQGNLSGKAYDNQTVLETIGRIKQSPVFENVKLVSMRQAGTGKEARELSFSINFRYNPAKKGS
jgi:hypothetical protein